MTRYNPDMNQRHSIRLREYDYSKAGAYFVTLCTQNRECLFGEIRDGGMRWNDAGEMVIDEWLHTGDVRGNVELDAFSVMPNHFNGILVLTDDDRGTARRAPTLEQFGKPVGGSLLDNENPDRVEQRGKDISACGGPSVLCRGNPAWLPYFGV